MGRTMSEVANNTCPICMAPSNIIAQQTRQSDNSLVFHCSKCDVAFLGRDKSSRDEKHFYNEIYPVDVNPDNLGTAPESVDQWRLDFSLPYLAKQQAVIEVGSAAGEFLNLVKPHVTSVTGCDLNSAQCKRAEEKFGIPSYSEDVRDLDFENHFDVVFMFQIFEHIWTPHEFLQDIRAKVKQGGLLILDIPNLNDAMYQMYQLSLIRDKFYFKEQHPMNYTPAALTKVMNANGFETVDVRLVQEYSVTNHLNWIYTNKGNASFEEGMKAQFDGVAHVGGYQEIWQKMDQYYKQLLLEAGFSDTIFAVFKKA